MHKNSFFDAIENVLVQILFEHLSDLRPALTFVEVGAYDGKTVSQTHRLATERNWRGIVIEPSPAAFSELQRTYQHFPLIRPVNCAVSDEEGILPFFSVRNSGAGTWEGMLSSLDRSTILRQRNLIPNIEDLIEEQAVSVRPLKAIMQEHRLTEVDLIKIDAEGRDDAVIRSIDFDAVRPQAIFLEHKLISDDRLWAMDSLLMAAGYRRLPMHANTFYLSSPFARDEYVSRVLTAGPELFPAGRDPEWGNGNWAGHAPLQSVTGLPARFRRLLRRIS